MLLSKPFLSKAEHTVIESAITQAEEKSTGEIRVMVYPRHTENVMETAAHEFSRQGMHKTVQRNGVLILISPKSRAFAVHADHAIYEKCGQEFWTQVAGAMEGAFRQNRFTDGIVAAVNTAGEQLAAHFPGSGVNPNELPNTVIDPGI